MMRWQPLKPVAGITALSVVLLSTLLAACGENDEEEPASETPTFSPAPTQSVSPITLTPTSPTANTTYSNTKHGYTVTVPQGWRTAPAFMEAFADRVSSPSALLVPEDYAVVTSASEEMELTAIQNAQSSTSLGLEPWLSFAAGQSVQIFPMDAHYPGITVNDFLRDVDQAGVIRTNSNVRTEELSSGGQATRLTRYESDNNGEFTYEVAIVEESAEEPILVRIVATPGYDATAFEQIWRSFR
jgi:hypothetical protein